MKAGSPFKMEQGKETLSQLFHLEFSKMVAVISKLFGLEHIEMAEDIVSETFLLALKTWEIKGMPANPAAWLYSVAKNKTVDHFRRAKIFDRKIVRELTIQQEKEARIEDFEFSHQNIRDSQLQMLFAVCNPAIASEAQIGLALQILCGFSIDEIAEAFLSNKETVTKRLFRAKSKLRSENVKMEFPPENEIDSRLDNVLHVIYLLFSEGYYSKTQNQILRKDLCLDALRLGIILTEYDKTNQPKTNALLALMCFHSSRFSARETAPDSVTLYENQNKDLWDQDLIRRGLNFLHLSAWGDQVSSYHLEARIACWHCMKEDSMEKWENILYLYNQLLLVNYSPSVALNRTFALYKANGRQAAIEEAEKLNLTNNHFYFLLLGELYQNTDNDKAISYLKKAFALTRTQTEKEIIQRKIDSLK